MSVEKFFVDKSCARQYKVGVEEIAMRHSASATAKSFASFSWYFGYFIGACGRELV